MYQIKDNFIFYPSTSVRIREIREEIKMLPLFVIDNEIDVEAFSQMPDHYENYEQALRWIRSFPHIEEIEVKPLKALVNKELKRGMLIGSIAYPKRKTVRTKIVKDRYGLIKSISSGVKAVQAFFIAYSDYTIVFSIGTANHDTCLFMRKDGPQYESILFNPTPLTRVKNAEDFLANFNTTSKRGYNAPDKNEHGWCTGYVWSTMNAFIQSGHPSPFTRDDLLKCNKSTQLYE